MKRSPFAPLALASILSVPLGCARADAPLRDDSEISAGPIAAPSWGPCDETWTTEATCTALTVPLEWQREGGATLPYFVRRFSPTSGNASRAQVWLVAGGPGEAGAPFSLVLPKLRAALPDVTFFVPDHRGSGRSARLGCDSGDDVSSACLGELARRYGPSGITAFSTTEAARDLGHAIDATRERGKPTYVYAVSYGTYLANRYLQLFPEQASGVVLDGVCSASGCADLATNPPDVIGRRFLDACRVDAVCSEKLGTDPVGRLQALYGKLDSGHCASITSVGFTSKVVKQVLASLLDDPEKRTLIAPLVYRFDRCSDADQRAIGNFARTLAAPPETAAEGYSTALLYTVARTEFFPPNLDLVDLEKRRVDDALFADAQTVSAAKGGASLPWPASEPAPRAWAETSIPVLLVNGTLDAQTPDYRLDDARAHFRGEHQALVLVPNTVHASLIYSDCTRTLVASFVADPTRVDTSCTKLAAPVDFRGAPGLAIRTFGTESLWD